MATSTSRRPAGRSTAGTGMTPAQTFALVVGLVYLAVGLVGWAVTDEFYGHDEDSELLGFALNGVHNLVHIALGVVWIAASRMPGSARAVNLLFGVVLLIVGLVGLTGVLDELLNIHDAGEQDNYLHIGTGVLSLAFAGLVGDRTARDGAGRARA